MVIWRLVEGHLLTLSANVLITFRKLSIITSCERYLRTLSGLFGNVFRTLFCWVGTLTRKWYFKLCIYTILDLTPVGWFLWSASHCHPLLILKKYVFCCRCGILFGCSGCSKSWAHSQPVRRVSSTMAWVWVRAMGFTPSPPRVSQITTRMTSPTATTPTPSQPRATPTASLPTPSWWQMGWAVFLWVSSGSLSMAWPSLTPTRRRDTTRWKETTRNYLTCVTVTRPIGEHTTITCDLCNVWYPLQFHHRVDRKCW